MAERTMTPEEYAAMAAVATYAVHHGFEVSMPTLGELHMKLKEGAVLC